MQNLSERVDQFAPPVVAADQSSLTLIGGYVAAIVHALEARGIATAVILKAAGIEQVPTNDPLTRVPQASMRRLFTAAREMTDDPYFGLYAAKFLHTTNLHALGHAMLASGSLRQLCEQLVRYFRLLSTTIKPALIEADAVARLEFVLIVESVPESDDLFGLFLVDLIRQLSDGRIHPSRVDLHRVAPPDGGTRHHRAFGCPVGFGATNTTLVFNRAALDVPWSGASRELAEFNEHIVVGYLAKLERSDIRMRVRALLLQQLPTGGVTKEGIAKMLFMSARTLQIKLAKCDTTFQDVVNETRLALARGYIDNSSLSITEISYMVGFSDTSNFSRAFRRWTGLSPRAYVARLRQTGTSDAV